jgi:molybdate transport repressor ModE-like protein
VVLSDGVCDQILAYDGENGLRGALQTLGDRRVFLPVQDKGILTNVHDQQELQAQLAEHNQALLHPMMHLRIERESAFFDTRLKLLLFLIADTRNVRKACALMGLSHSKAWNMLNRLEMELGYQVVKRRQGGSRGGQTCLTQRGETFLLTYQQYEETVFNFAQEQFQTMFILPKML